MYIGPVIPVLGTHNHAFLTQFDSNFCFISMLFCVQTCVADGMVCVFSPGVFIFREIPCPGPIRNGGAYSLNIHSWLLSFDYDVYLRFAK